MALGEPRPSSWNVRPPAFEPLPAAAPMSAPMSAPMPAQDQRPPIPFDALARLPRLRDAAGRDWRTGRFLARAPLACLLLMAAGTLAIATGGGTLKSHFAWGVLLLIGIVAMIRNHMRGHARTLRRTPLEEAADDLRFLLLYMGTAWGTGAFLVMPGQPLPFQAVAFCLAPALGLSLILRDEKAAVAFTTPVLLLTAGAALLGAWPAAPWVALAILAGGGGALALPALQHRRTALPPMLRPQE